MTVEINHRTKKPKRKTKTTTKMDFFSGGKVTRANVNGPTSS